MKPVYLKPNVVIEPLFDQWYAWSHLISPGTAARNVVNRHLTIMDSFIDSPELHEQAIRNPKMRGGPFMDIPEHRVDEIRDLRENTLRTQAQLIQLNEAITELEDLLEKEATGNGLESMYDKIPEPLKGLIEISYDRRNHGGFRFFEALLYRSVFYREQSQSIALWITNNDERPFCLSTPRLNDDNVLNIQIPFKHSAIDELAKMKRTPKPIETIAKMLGVDPGHKVFASLFTDESAPNYERYSGDRIRMRYFGHACILIETETTSILVDPLISYYGYKSSVEHFSDYDLPEVIDYILITHNHQDHVLFETLLPLRHKVKNIIVPKTNSGKLEDPSLKLMMEQIGFKNVMEIAEMETINMADAIITGIPFLGEHSDLNILTKSCFLIQISDFKLLFLADSRVIAPQVYQSIHDFIGDVDVIFLGMECDGAPLTWLYGPLMTKKISRENDISRRLAGSDCKQGMEVVNIFNPKEVYVYAMGQEPWVEFISSVKYTDESNPIIQSNKLVAECRKRGIVAERLYGEKEILYSKRSVVSVSNY